MITGERLRQLMNTQVTIKKANDIKARMARCQWRLVDKPRQYPWTARVPDKTSHVLWKPSQEKNLGPAIIKDTNSGQVIISIMLVPADECTSSCTHDWCISCNILVDSTHEDIVDFVFPREDGEWWQHACDKLSSCWGQDPVLTLDTTDIWKQLKMMLGRKQQ